MTTVHLTKSMSRSPLRLALLLIPLVFACFAVSQSAQGVIPAPDGGYPGLNTAEGQNAFKNLTTGSGNTAVGWFSLKSLATGSFNTGIGAGTLALNTGDNDTATGAAALLSNTIGQWNTANGAGALFSNTIGISNTANGFHALFSNTTGGANTATGSSALLVNTGDFNTANGFSALQNNTTGQLNVALGVDAGFAVTTANNVICIGANGANVNNSCFIGNIYGTSEGGTISAVYVNSDGQLGTQPPPSARRFKKQIKPMDMASEAILRLKPVTFQYKSDIKDTQEFGLIAEEVAKADPNLVVRDQKGEIYTVRYDAVNAMLLNEFLKEHRKVEEMEKAMVVFSSRLKAQEAQIQKVSAQLDASKPAPQVVNNP
jgi:hypothetical protein